jgi:hypothetical protein
MCVCVQGPYFEGEWVSVFIRSTITVLYYNSGNFLTARRNEEPVNMPVTVTVRNSESCRTSYYSPIHQTIKKLFVIIDNECVLDEVKTCIFVCNSYERQYSNS